MERGEGRGRVGLIQVERKREREGQAEGARDLILYLGRPFPNPAVGGDSDI